MSARRTTTDPLRAARLCVAVALAAQALVAPVAAQTINGTLLDLNTDQPINLALVLMFTEAGDSVGLAVTDERGRFTLTSPEAGSFLLRASALGYSEAPAGVFELGAGGVMSIEYRLAPAPLPLDALVVSLDRPVIEHELVRNGFVRRLQRGLGHFITPHDIEESPATSTEQLLTHVPGVRVGMATMASEVQLPDASDVVTLITPRPDIGETVQIRGPGGGWCTPSIYVDGIRTFYAPDPTSGSIMRTLSSMVPLATVEAIEVYRRPAEIPVEYTLGQAGSGGTCGVLVLWTRSGPSSGGQTVYQADVPAATGATGPGGGPLPPAAELGPTPAAGERIRMQLASGVAQRLGLASPWEGYFLVVREGEFVGNDPRLGRVVAVPLDAVQELQVRRERPKAYILRRGAIAGTAFGVGMWQFLRLLCRGACRGGVESAWFPAATTGLVVAVLVGGQGPGTHWVSAPVPEGGPPSLQTPR